LLQKEPKVSNDSIASTLDITPEMVATIIAGLIAKKVIEKTVEGAIKVIIKTPKVDLPQILIRYTYEKRAEASGAEILPTSRPFCKKLVAMSNAGKMWSRANIQAISQAVGYSVFKRAGGFWNNNGTIEYQCRHEWVANAVIKK
jgi:hypothetical protein